MKYSFTFAEWKNSGSMIRASVYCAAHKRAPWVIMCPGFTSHRIGPKYFYVSIARHLAANGINQDGYYEFGPHEMKIDFLNEFKKCRPVSALSNGFKGKMLLLQGDKDDQITVKESKAYVVTARKSGIPSTYRIVKNGDHRFSSVQSRAFIQQTIVPWIKENII